MRHYTRDEKLKAVQLYIKYDNININLLEFKNAKGEVELSLKKQFDEIYRVYTRNIIIN